MPSVDVAEVRKREMSALWAGLVLGAAIAVLAMKLLG